MFVENAHSAACLEPLLTANKFSPAGLESLQDQFERLVVLDFIIRNTDRGMRHVRGRVRQSSHLGSVGRRATAVGQPTAVDGQPTPVGRSPTGVAHRPVR